MPELQVLGQHQAGSWLDERLIADMTMMSLLPWVVAAGLASAGLTWLSIALAQRYQMIDTPDDPRRLHSHPTPRGGGLGIAVILLIAMLAWPAPTSAPWLAFAGMALIILAGGLDDLHALSVWTKLSGQLAGAVLVALALPVPGLAVALGVVLALLGTVSLVNIWNFMDGSNGLASTQALLLATALFVLTDHPVMLVLAAACLGFLPFNLFKAKIFLGDIGSHVLGAAVALGLLIGLAADAVTPPQALLLVSAFVLDAGWTLTRRSLRGEPVWQAHSQHLYQTAIRRGHSHQRICLAYALWTGGAIALALAMRQWPAERQWLATAMVALLGTLIFFLLPRRWQRGADRAGSPSR